jgi:hypothetical protein
MSRVIEFRRFRITVVLVGAEELTRMRLPTILESFDTEARAVDRLLAALRPARRDEV